MSNRYGLSEKTIQAVCGVLARHPEIEEATLFGSRAKGTYRPGSDIDLILQGSGLSHRALNRIHGELDDLPIPYGVSLILAHELTDPEVRLHIDRVGILFYRRNAVPTNA